MNLGKFSSRKNENGELFGKRIELSYRESISWEVHFLLVQRKMSIQYYFPFMSLWRRIPRHHTRDAISVQWPVVNSYTTSSQKVKWFCASPKRSLWMLSEICSSSSISELIYRKCNIYIYIYIYICTYIKSRTKLLHIY